MLLEYNFIMVKYLISLLGIVLSIPLLMLIVMVLILPISISGIGYLAACSLAIAGMILVPWLPKYSMPLIVVGLLGLVAISGARITLGKRGSSIQMVTLPSGKEARWASYIIDEQDSLIVGEALFHSIGGTSAREHENITQALKESYSRMKDKQGIVPSPVIDTYLNLQNPAAFDAVVIEPGVNRHPDTGVIFLHGFMGNVTAQCWEIAQAVSQFGAVTICPSTEWQGKWWEPQGEEILRSTFSYLRNQGISKIYLGGFSNGGFGISRLIAKLGDEKGLNGLIFVDGIGYGENIRKAGLPVLIVQGTQDERMPAPEARRIAETIGGFATYSEIDSDHFVIMKEPKSVQDALYIWLENQTP